MPLNILKFHWYTLADMLKGRVGNLKSNELKKTESAINKRRSSNFYIDFNIHNYFFDLFLLCSGKVTDSIRIRV